MMKSRKYMITTLLSVLCLCGLYVSANDFQIIPQGTDSSQIATDVTAVGEKGGSLWENYKDIAYGKKDANGIRQTSDRRLGDELASGIMTWDTILTYVVYLVRFLSQLGLVIGAAMIIYAGYVYATSVFKGGDAGAGKKAITHAIEGVLVISFSYAILKFAISALL